MARGAPDGVLLTQIAVTVENVPIVPEPATEAAAGALTSTTTTSQTYVAASEWEVSADKVGELKEILIISSNYAKTLVRIIIAGTTLKNNWAPQAAMPLIFEDLKLKAAACVTIQIRSSDGTSITVDVAIVGKEIG